MYLHTSVNIYVCVCLCFADYVWTIGLQTLLCSKYSLRLTIPIEFVVCVAGTSVVGIVIVIIINIIAVLCCASACNCNE